MRAVGALCRDAGDCARPSVHRSLREHDVRPRARCTATTTPRKVPRSSSGRRRSTCCCTRSGAVPKNPNAGLSYPDAMAGVPLRAVWQIGLWAVVLPAIGLLLLLRRAVEWIEPGLGTAAAAILGLATLVLPFSTLLFAHVPAAAFAFLAFCLLFRETAARHGRRRRGRACGRDRSAARDSGRPDRPLCGLARRRACGVSRVCAPAVSSACCRSSPSTSGRSAIHSSSPTPARPARGPRAAGSPRASSARASRASASLVELLLSQRGLLVLTPVVAAGAAGCVLLWRRGLRAEAGLIAALVLVELVWNSARHPVGFALGGWVPGPRFLIPLLPFLCFALAPALRRRPATVGGARPHLGGRDGGRDERRAAAAERRHAPLALAHRARQLHGDRRQPRRRRSRLARDPAVLRVRARRGRRRVPRDAATGLATRSARWRARPSSPGSSSSTARRSCSASTASCTRAGGSPRRSAS